MTEASPRHRRILLVGSFESTSGAPMAMLRLSRGLADRGHDVRASFLYRKHVFTEFDYPSEVLCVDRPAGLRALPYLVRSLYSRMKTFKPDAVITFLPFANCLGQLTAAFCRVPVRIVSPRVPVWSYSAPMRLLDTLLAWSGAYTSVIAVSEGTRQSCAHYPKRLFEGARVIYNGLADWTPSGLTKEQARARFSLREGAFILLAVGRLSRQKNHRLLLEAVSDNPDCELIIAGEGELRGQIEDEIKARNLEDRVTLLGNIARADMPHLLRAADVFVQPSLFEGQSNALLEALASGLPALVSDLPEQRETIVTPDGRIAGAIIPFDATAWRNEIRRFQEDTELRRRASEVANIRSGEFAFDRMIDGYEEAIAGPKPGQQKASRNAAAGQH